MVLGLYYLTKSRPGTKGEGRTFASMDDVLIALEMGEVETLTPIKLRYTGRVIDLTKAFDNQNIIRTEPIEFAQAVHGTPRSAASSSTTFCPRTCRSSTACSRRRASPSSCSTAT